MLQWVAGVSARVLVYIHSEFLRLLYFLADRQASDDFTALGPRICLTRRSIATAAASTSTSIAAPSAWRALRLLLSVAPVARRHAAVPRALQLRVALDDWGRNDVHERVRA